MNTGAPTGSPLSTPRLAERVEALEVAEVWLASRRGAGTQIPPCVHDDEDVRRWMREDVLGVHEVWVLGDPGALAAMLVLSDEWIEHLFVHPEHWHEGLGSRLVVHAQGLRSRLDLWTFQSNVTARRFYAHHGFLEVAFTDGDNEEGAPDVRCHWELGATP